MLGAAARERERPSRASARWRQPEWGRVDGGEPFVVLRGCLFDSPLRKGGARFWRFDAW